MLLFLSLVDGTELKAVALLVGASSHLQIVEKEGMTHEEEEKEDERGEKNDDKKRTRRVRKTTWRRRRRRKIRRGLKTQRMRERRKRMTFH